MGLIESAARVLFISIVIGIPNTDRLAVTEKRACNFPGAIETRPRRNTEGCSGFVIVDVELGNELPSFSKSVSLLRRLGERERRRLFRIVPRRNKQGDTVPN